MCFTVEKPAWFLFPLLVPCFFSSWADWLLTGFCLCPSSSLPLLGCISVLIALYQFFLRLSGHLILQFQVLLYCTNLFRMGFPGGSDGRVHLQCRRPGFDPWVGRISWRRARQPTPVFLPGESHGQRSLVGCSPWDPRELDTTEQLTLNCRSFIRMSFKSSWVPFSFLVSSSIMCRLDHFCPLYLSLSI